MVICLLEMLPSDLCDTVYIHGIVTGLELLGGNRITNAGLRSILAEARQIRAAESFCDVRQEGHGHIRRHWRLFQGGLEDALPSRKVWQWNVDELVKATGSQQSIVKQLRPVGSTDNENILLHANTINLGQQLVHRPIACPM